MYIYIYIYMYEPGVSTKHPISVLTKTHGCMVTKLCCSYCKCAIVYKEVHLGIVICRESI